MNFPKIQKWDKKSRTTLHSIKVGDIFLMAIDDSRYAAGRIISKVDIGHGAEFFDLILSNPEISATAIESAKRLCSPVFLDSYGLFDRKIEGDWRIVGHDQSLFLADENIYFTYGAGQYWKVDIFGNETEISKEESEKYPPYSPQGDAQIKDWLTPMLVRAK